MNKFSTKFVCGVFALLWSAATHAQAPQLTTATYEDWVLRCSGTPPQKSCEVVQFTQMQGQAGILTQIALGNPKKGDSLKMVVQVPMDAWMPTGVKLLLNDKDPGVIATFKRCLPGACFADVEIKDDTINKFRSAIGPGKLVFKDVAQKDISLPVSFKGFGAAFDAMQKE
jgi:invasion protein IalB